MRAGGWAGVDDAGDVEGVRWSPDLEDPMRGERHGGRRRSPAGSSGAVRGALSDGADRALVLGGDCTVGIGAVAGRLLDRGRVGLVYLDLHADMNVPDATDDGALDWMGVAHLLALDGARRPLRDVGLRTPLLSGDDVVLVGFDPDHATALRAGGDRRARPHGRRRSPSWRNDPKGAARRALAALSGCDVLAVHLDVDVIDFLDAAAVGEHRARRRRDAGGRAGRASRCSRPTSATATVTITELNPDHGAADGSTLRTFVDGLAAALVPRS